MTSEVFRWYHAVMQTWEYDCFWYASEVSAIFFFFSLALQHCIFTQHPWFFLGTSQAESSTQVRYLPDPGEARASSCLKQLTAMEYAVLLPDNMQSAVRNIPSGYRNVVFDATSDIFSSKVGNAIVLCWICTFLVYRTPSRWTFIYYYSFFSLVTPLDHR